MERETPEKTTEVREEGKDVDDEVATCEVWRMWLLLFFQSHASWLYLSSKFQSRLSSSWIQRSHNVGRPLLAIQGVPIKDNFSRFVIYVSTLLSSKSSWFRPISKIVSFSFGRISLLSLKLLSKQTNLVCDHHKHKN